MHYSKYQKGAVGSILLHSNRGIDSPDTHEHSNESIDKTRTHLNYDLKDRGGLTAYEYYKKRIDDIASETKERTGKSIRKDAVTLCSWAVTAPKDLPEEKLQDFFKGAYEWFAERYGADNIVTAVVHMDEQTPHMHLQFTPIIEKDGVRKLCAKEIETRRTLSTAHQNLQNRLQQALGCEVNLLNGATENGSKTVLELKNDVLKQSVAESEDKIRQAEELQQQVSTMQEQVDILQKQALAYEIPTGKKKLLESKEDFESRTRLKQKEVALEVKEKSLDERETRLFERESDFDGTVQAEAKHWVATEANKTISKLTHQIKQVQAESARNQQQAQQQLQQMQNQITLLEEKNEQLRSEKSMLASYVEQEHESWTGEMMCAEDLVPQAYPELQLKQRKRGHDMER